MCQHVTISATTTACLRATSGSTDGVCAAAVVGDGGNLPIEKKKSLLHQFAAKRLGNIQETFKKFSKAHNVNLSNKTTNALEKAKQAAVLQQNHDDAKATQELSALKAEYRATKHHKKALLQRARELKEEIELAQVKQQIKAAAEKMLASKKRMHELGYAETVQKKALTFQKLYTIKYGGSAYRYVNNPEHPGVRTENDGGAYSRYGWNMDPEWHGAQKCEEYSKCNDVFIKGTHDDGSGTCNDDPMYYDCDGDSCQYYEEYPDECGQHDDDCGGPDTVHFTASLQNPCSSQGKKMQGCCVCQHHKEQFDGCGTNQVGLHSEGWTCSESKSDYTDAGCGTWETCEERIAKVVLRRIVINVISTTQTLSTSAHTRNFYLACGSMYPFVVTHDCLHDGVLL